MASPTTIPEVLPGRLAQFTKHLGFPLGEVGSVHSIEVTGTGRPFYYKLTRSGLGLIQLHPEPVEGEDLGDKRGREERRYKQHVAQRDQITLQHLLKGRCSIVEAERVRHPPQQTDRTLHAWADVLTTSHARNLSSPLLCRTYQKVSSGSRMAGNTSIST